MDDDPDPSEVPKELIELVKTEAIWRQLCDEWERIYPTNPVSDEQNEE